MNHFAIYVTACCLTLFLASCSLSSGRERPEKWNGWDEKWSRMEDEGAQDGEEGNDAFDLDEIQHSGELIALTLRGPLTYYSYQHRPLGLHFLLCQRFSSELGVRLRMEVCRDTAELYDRLHAGDGDLIAVPLREGTPGWVVAEGKEELAEKLAAWCDTVQVAAAREEEKALMSCQHVKRRVYAPMLDRQGGVISRWDGLFVKYAARIHWDWRLLAAQCYQESTFDPEAVSWAGARGLMQIMPQTADHLGLSRSLMNSPEPNIAAATRYIAELETTFSDIPRPTERQLFVLAAYNGGPHHIRDAMALCREAGGSGQTWGEVAPWVLRLSQPEYYQREVVKNGYMRGQETVDYVSRIRERYNGYRGVPARAAKPGTSYEPQKASNDAHRKKFDATRPAKAK